MTVAGMVVIYLTGVVFGVGGASLYVALRRAKPRKKEWGDTLTLVCPMCRTENEWDSAIMARLASTCTEHMLFEWLADLPCCSDRRVLLDSEKGTTKVGRLGAGPSKGCGAKLTAAFLHHPYWLELQAKKAFVDELNAEAMREAGAAPEVKP